MSLHLPTLRGTGRRRAIDKVAELREENVLLHTQRAAADDYFMQLDQHRKELEDEVEQLKAQRAADRAALAAIQKDRDALERWVKDLEGQLADAERRLDVRTWAEAAAAKTQEIPIITAVVPLNQAPLATADPGRVRPSLAIADEGVA